MNILKIRLLPLACLAMLPISAMASSVWQLWDNTNPYACNLSGGSTSIGNSYNCSAVAATDPAMTMNAWSTTGTGSTFAEASVQRWNWTYSLTNPTDTPFNLAGQSSGYDYGVINANEARTDGTASSPNHAIDNYGATDLMALNFTQQVALTSVSIGWYQTDADISILRYAGSGDPAAINGQSISQLIRNGWELVGHYADLQNDTTTPVRTVDITNNAGASSWWLVSAYNADYGSGTTAHGGVVSSCTSGLTCGNDYVKLLQVAGNTIPHSKTPEPGAMMLLGTGLLGMMALRRRRQSAV